MKPLAARLQMASQRRLQETGVPTAVRENYLKWLRYYLDVRAKYRHPPRDPDSLQSFLQKPAAKGQTSAQQKQAFNALLFLYRQATTAFSCRAHWNGSGRVPARISSGSGSFPPAA